MMRRLPAWAFAAGVLALALAVNACAPGATPQREVDPGLTPFGLEPVPRSARPVVAVPSFEVRTGSVRIGGEDVEGRREADGIYRDLGDGVGDVFLTEAVRSGRFVVTERAELEQVLQEQDLGQSGRVRPDTAAQVGRVTGAEYLVLGSVTEFGVDTTGVGGRFFGVFGGRTETVTARVGVDVRLVDAVTAEVIAVGAGTAEVSQSNVQIDVLNVIRALGAGRSGTTLVDVAVRNAIRASIDEAATSLAAALGGAAQPGAGE